MTELAITELLHAAAAGDPEAMPALMPMVYTELRRIAGAYMRGQQPGHTLQTTALVHEAYLKFGTIGRLDCKDRAHFFGIAAAAMRHILVDHAKSSRREKRGGTSPKLSLDALPQAPGAPQKDADVLALDDAMSALERVDPRKGRVLELRYFGGLSGEEIAETLAISTATVARELRMGQIWLRRELQVA